MFLVHTQVQQYYPVLDVFVFQIELSHVTGMLLFVIVLCLLLHRPTPPKVVVTRSLTVQLCAFVNLHLTLACPFFSSVVALTVQAYIVASYAFLRGKVTGI